MSRKEIKSPVENIQYDKIYVKEKRNLLLEIVPSLLGAIIGGFMVLIGNHINFANSEESYRIRHIQELKESSYTNLLRLREPFLQTLRSLYIGKSNSQYFMLRYKLISRDTYDYSQAIESEKEVTKYFDEIRNYDKEFYGTLAQIKISYNLNKETNSLIDSLNNYGGLYIAPWFEVNGIKTIEDLNSFSASQKTFIHKDYSDNIERQINTLLSILLLHIKKE